MQAYRQVFGVFTFSHFSVAFRQTENSPKWYVISLPVEKKSLKCVNRKKKQILCSLWAEWRIQGQVHLQGPWQSHVKTGKSPQVNCRSRPGSPGTGSTVPSHQGDTRRGQSCRDGWVITNSCRGTRINAGYRANASTRSPPALWASKWKSLLRG